MKTKRVKVKDLKDQIGTNGPRPLLLCRRCGGEFSANAGDYWNANPETVLKHCGRLMALVVKQTVYEESIDER